MNAKLAMQVRRAERLREAIRRFGLSARVRDYMRYFGYADAPTIPRVARCARASALDAFAVADPARLRAAFDALDAAVPVQILNSDARKDERNEQ